MYKYIFLEKPTANQIANMLLAVYETMFKRAYHPGLYTEPN